MFAKFKVKDEHLKEFSNALRALEKTLNHSLVLRFKPLEEGTPLYINSKNNDILFCSLYFKSNVFDFFEVEDLKKVGLQHPSQFVTPFSQFRSPEVTTNGTEISFIDEDKTEFTFPLLDKEMDAGKGMNLDKAQDALIFKDIITLEKAKDLMKSCELISESDEFLVTTESGSNVMKLVIGTPETGVFKQDYILSNPSVTTTSQVFPKTELFQALRAITTLGGNTEMMSLNGLFAFRIQNENLSLSYGIRRLDEN